jgi:thiamine pyrophosphokinase
VRALILANGEPPSAEFAAALASQHDLVIATDGAAHTAAAMGLEPSIVCGDFDSVDLEAARRELPGAEFIETPDQNLADLEKAILLARDRGAFEVTLLGGAGDRIDHSLTAIALLLRYHTELSLVMRHDGSEVRAVSGRPESPGILELAAMPGDTISLITFAEENCVSISGVKWPLSNARLPVGTGGVSNLAVSGRVEVSISNGSMIVCRLSNKTAS